MNILLASQHSEGLAAVCRQITANGHICMSWEREEEIPAKDDISIIFVDMASSLSQGLSFYEKLRFIPEFRLIYKVALIREPDGVQLTQFEELGFDDVLDISVDEEMLAIALRFMARQVRLRNTLFDTEQRLLQSSSELMAMRDDIHNTLDHLRMGSCMIDEHGQLEFLSQMAQKIFEVDERGYRGRPWSEILSFKPSDLDELASSIKDASDKRFQHSFHLRTPGGRYYWIDVEVIVNPRRPDRKTLLLYDMSEMNDLRRMLDDKAKFHDLVGKSKPMLAVYQAIQEIASVNMTTLIEGETGTGKELVARAIHSEGSRKGKPFVAVNCAGLTDSLLTSQLFGHRRGSFTGAIDDHQGVFEAANGGTLFLDEIGEIPMNVQTTLLRVLQEREVTRVGESTPRKVDVHVITATNRNLLDEVEKGTFRSDLLYRIRVARINLPALRDRKEDIPLLVGSLLTKKRAMTGKKVDSISNSALRVLLDYHWPGNVRELENVVEFAVLRCKGEILTAQDLPPELAEQTSQEPSVGGTSRRRGEREQILDAIRQADGNRKKAAEFLGVSRATFYRRLARFGLNDIN